MSPNISQVLPSDFRRKFNKSSTALQVLHGRDLTGQVAIITGANAGIGFETARSLAMHGCHVVFACRNASLAEEAIGKIRKERPDAGENCEVLRLDLSLLRNVVEFADAVREKFAVINILVLNAAVLGMPHSATGDGLEMTYQVCHLSHFYLTLLLQPVLRRGSRVVVVSSEAHRFSKLSSKTISPTTLSPGAKKYWDVMAYNNAKLCNVLFAQELARRWQQQGILVFSLHPGNFVATNISKNWWFYRAFFTLLRPFTKSVQQAASTSVYCATSKDLNQVTGLYFNHCNPCEPSRAAQDQTFAESLWDISVEMIKTILGPDAPGFTCESENM